MSQEQQCDKNGGEAILPLPPVGAYLCESVETYAKYWLKAAHEARDAGRNGDAVMFAEQAVNGWKNLAYDLARQAHYYLKTQRHYAEQHTHDLYKTGDKNAPPSILDRNGEVVLGLCKLCGMGEAELVEPCAPSHERVFVVDDGHVGIEAVRKQLESDTHEQAINLEGVTGDEMDKGAERAALLTRLMAAGEPRETMPSTTRQSIETPRTDALRALMGEIYEPDNLALDHMLEKYGELERELAEAMNRCDEALEGAEAAVRQRDSALSTTPRIDGYKFYCDTFHELYPGKVIEFSAVVIQEMAERLSAGSATPCSTPWDQCQFEIVGWEIDKGQIGISVKHAKGGSAWAVEPNEHVQKLLRDGLRYRWLRHDSKELKTEQLKGQFVELYQGAALDEKIDKQMNTADGGTKDPCAS